MKAAKDIQIRIMATEKAEEPKRPGVLEKIVPIYEHEFSRVPDRIRVSFSDGSTAVYNLHTDMPEPIILENIQIIRKWKRGYPPRRRRMG